MVTRQETGHEWPMLVRKPVVAWQKHAAWLHRPTGPQPPKSCTHPKSPMRPRKPSHRPPSNRPAIEYVPPAPIGAGGRTPAAGRSSGGGTVRACHRRYGAAANPAPPSRGRGYGPSAAMAAGGMVRADYCRHGVWCLLRQARFRRHGSGGAWQGPAGLAGTSLGLVQLIDYTVPGLPGGCCGLGGGGRCSGPADWCRLSAARYCRAGTSACCCRHGVVPPVGGTVYGAGNGQHGSRGGGGVWSPARDRVRTP